MLNQKKKIEKIGGFILKKGEDRNLLKNDDSKK